MSLLTDQELFAALDADNESIADAKADAESWATIQAMATAIESAVIKKLAAGVKVEPVAYLNPKVFREGKVCVHDSLTWSSRSVGGWTEAIYTATEIAAARVQALEEAAMVSWNFHMDRSKRMGISPGTFEQWSPTSAIRALIGGKQE